MVRPARRGAVRSEAAGGWPVWVSWFGEWPNGTPPVAPKSGICMDLDQIKALTELMVENDLTELMLRDGETRVVLRRNKPGSGAGAVVTAVSQPMASGVGVPQPVAVAPVAASAEVGQSIKSPMVGTFYSAAGPDSPAFVTAGSRVEPDTVVCIIEAMKVFNEIKAEVSGTIERVLVNNGQPVEYGQPLFLVK